MPYDLQYENILLRILYTFWGLYGIANINWAKNLIQQGVDVSINPKFMIRPGTDEWEVLDKEERDLFGKEFESRDIGIIEATPDHFHLNKSKIKIANTMAETDRISDRWVEACNTQDYIIVPNEFYKDVFIKSGVVKPITVIPHGVDVEHYSYYKRSETPYTRPFVFGMCGYLNNRKSVFEVIRAFSSEFDNDERVRLKLHSTDPDLWYYKNLRDKRIQITNNMWSKHGVKEFYNSLDCFVFPSKAEGIGYPPREAMATGIPSIIMDYSGLSDIADEKYNYVIKPAGWEYTNPMADQPGKWASVDIPELMYWMRHAFENRVEVHGKGLLARAEMEKVSWENTTKKLIDFLQEVHEVHSL